MPSNDVSIHIEAEDRSRQAFRQAEQSVDALERQTRELQGTTRATAAALGLSGNAARETTTNFTSLGRQIFKRKRKRSVSEVSSGPWMVGSVRQMADLSRDERLSKIGHRRQAERIVGLVSSQARLGV